MEKYEPYLIGITHHHSYLQSVLDRIAEMKQKPKTIGIEANPSSVKDEELLIRVGIVKQLPFWSNLKHQLEKQGIKVEFLLTDTFNRQFLNEIYQPTPTFSASATSINPNKKLNEALTEKEIQGKLSAIVSTTIPKIMIQQALKKKPDLIICGAKHAPILRTNLRIPKQKFTLITHVTTQMLQHEIKRVRRFERKRGKKLPRTHKK